MTHIQKVFSKLQYNLCYIRKSFISILSFPLLIEISRTKVTALHAKVLCQSLFCYFPFSGKAKILQHIHFAITNSFFSRGEAHIQHKKLQCITIHSQWVQLKQTVRYTWSPNQQEPVHHTCKDHRGTATSQLFSKVQHNKCICRTAFQTFSMHTVRRGTNGTRLGCRWNTG